MPEQDAEVAVGRILGTVAASLQPGDAAWLVGGAVRDLFVGTGSADFDFAVRGDTETLARRVADRLEGSFFTYSEAFSTYRVVLPGATVDLAPLRGADITRDLRLRDFTVNAMALPADEGAAGAAGAPMSAYEADGDSSPSTGDSARSQIRDDRARSLRLVDPLGGLADLTARRLVPCSRPAFREDPVRVLRFVRMIVGLCMTAEAAVFSAARQAIPALASCSPERQAHELTVLLGLPLPAAAVRLLDEIGALDVVLPELNPLKGCLQNPYHHLDVFGHTLEALAHAGPVVEQLGGKEFLAAPEACGLPGAAPMAPLAWAMLLHDIGKPGVRRVDADGHVLFWHHDELGVTMSDAIVRRLHMSRRFAAYLRVLILNHLRLGFLVRESPLTQRALVRYRRAVEPFVFESVALSLADRLATRGEKTSSTSIARHFRLARHVWLEMPRQSPQLPLGGRDVMELLGLDEGPLIGEAMAALRDEVDAGEITGPDEARRFLSAWWREREGHDA